MCVWGGGGGSKDPKESIKFSITIMHCRCGRPNYTLIVASNPKHRPAFLRFVPGEAIRHFSDILFLLQPLVLI